MTPRYATRSPSRGGTSFQRFRAESPELSEEDKAAWSYLTLPPMESQFDAEMLIGRRSSASSRRQPRAVASSCQPTSPRR